MEGSGRRIIFHNLKGDTEENIEKRQSGQSVSKQRFESWTSRIPESSAFTRPTSLATSVILYADEDTYA
jgi:hypothetical protein